MLWLTGHARSRHAQLRGALRAAVTPVSMTVLAAQALGDHTHGKKSSKGSAAAAAVNPSTVTAIVEQLVADGAVRGTLKSGATPLA